MPRSPPLPGDSLQGDVGSLPSQLEEPGEEGEMSRIKAFHREELRWADLFQRATRRVAVEQLTLIFCFCFLHCAKLRREGGRGKLMYGSYCAYVNEYEYRCVQFFACVGWLMHDIMTDLTTCP